MVIVSCHGVVFLEPELEETVALGFADSAVVAIVQPVSVEGGKSAGVLMRFALVLSAVALVLSAVALVLSAVALVLSAVDSNSKVDLLVMLAAVLNGSSLFDVPLSVHSVMQFDCLLSGSHPLVAVHSLCTL